MLYRFFITVLIQCLLYFAPVSISASLLDCADSSVTFLWDESEKVECACSSAYASINFLESIGLKITKPINIKLVKQISSKLDSNVIGMYTPANANQIVLLNYSSVLEVSQLNKPQLNIDMSEDVWCGYVAHEVAHAISCQYLSSINTNRMAREYISAVTQLTILSTETREKFLKENSEVDAYQSIEEMSELYFFLDPSKFAVKCYLHFISLDDPKAFIGRLLEAEDDF